MAFVDTAIVAERPDVEALLAKPASTAGAIAVFIGVVRETPAADTSSGKAVRRLEYEAHLPMAEERLREIAETAASKWGLTQISAVHRTGTCEIGEPTVVVVCRAPHRAEALDACRWAVDELKATVPIWKKEIYADGSAWVGLETVHHSG